MSLTGKRAAIYVENWRKRGYPQDIPDEVPAVLMKKNLAPSYKAIAQAVLSNDLRLTSLGFSTRRSGWYGVFKKIELAERECRKGEE